MEKQDKVIAQVYMTYDYDKFKKLADNRALYIQRLNKIKSSFLAGEVLNPIVVNEKMEIIDGQGRFEAKKEMGLPIYYIVSKGADIEDCRRMNSYSTNWSQDDYVESWSESNENYQRIKSLHIRTKMPYSRILRLAGHSENKQSTLSNTRENVIKSGLLEFSEKDVKRVEILSSHITDVMEALDLAKKPNGSFYTALAIAWSFDGYEPKRMVEKCKARRHHFIGASSIEDQLKTFSEIYNYRTSPAKKIYFEDYMRNRGHNVRTYDNTGFAKKPDDDISSLNNK